MSGSENRPLLEREEISVSLASHKRQKGGGTLGSLISYACCICTMFCLQGFFHFPVSMAALCVFALAVQAVLRLTQNFLSKAHLGMILCCFMAVPLVIALNYDKAADGLELTYFFVRSAVLKRSFYVDPANPEDAAAIAGNQMLCFLLTLLLLAIMEYTDVLLHSRRGALCGVLIRILATFPFLESGLYYGVHTWNLAALGLVICWVVSFVIARRKPPRYAALRRNGETDPLAETISQKAQDGLMVHESSALVTLVLLMILGAGTYLVAERVPRSPKLDETRGKILEATKDFSIHDITGWFQKLPFLEGGPRTVSDEVEFDQSDGPDFSGSLVLRVTAGQAASPEDYYLRGTVRSEYTGTGWGIAKNLYKREERLFEQLVDANRMPQTVLHSDHTEELKNENGKYPVVPFSVTAYRTEAVNYLPYEGIFPENARYRYDTEVLLDDRQNYSAWLLCGVQKDWAVFSEESASSPNQAVRDYEDFVREAYLNVPETDAMDRVKAAFEPYAPPREAPLKERLDAIRDYLWDSAEYTLTPGATPVGQDFAEYFLLTNHKGYCAHYATAAVLLCRLNGIPARYCQGYVLTRENFANAVRSGDELTMDIEDYQSHAWAEIYVPGFGWQPYEFTESVAETWNSQTYQTSATTTTTQTSQTTTLTTTRSAVPTQTSETYGSSTAVSSAPARFTGTGDGELPGRKPNVFGTVLTILIILAILALLCLGWFLWDRKVLRRRERDMNDANPNRAANASYRYLLLLLKLLGIEQGGLSHEDFAALAEDSCKLLPPGTLRHAVMTQRAVTFSRQGADEHQAQKLRGTAKALERALMTDASRPKRLLLRVVRHIPYPPKETEEKQ